MYSGYNLGCRETRESIRRRDVGSHCSVGTEREGNVDELAMMRSKWTFGPRLVEARIGAAGAPVATVGTVAFRLYLLIIVQTLTN